MSLIIDHDENYFDLTYPAGEDIPVLLQQAPKSLGQGSATVLRGLLDPELEGEITRSTVVYICCTCY